MINPPSYGWIPAHLVALSSANFQAKETLNAAKRYVDVYKLGAVSWHLNSSQVMVTFCGSNHGRKNIFSNKINVFCRVKLHYITWFMIEQSFGDEKERGFEDATFWNKTSDCIESSPCGKFPHHFTRSMRFISEKWAGLWSCWTFANSGPGIILSTCSLSHRPPVLPKKNSRNDHMAGSYEKKLRLFNKSRFQHTKKITRTLKLTASFTVPLKNCGQLWNYFPFRKVYF